MTLGLARRLLWDGLVSPDEVSRALHLHVNRRVSFLAALGSEHPGLLARVDAEVVGYRGTPAPLRVDAALHAAAPPALWTMLCAVPIGKTPEGRVRVAAPDGGDGHVETELAHQLASPVELVLAPATAVLSALAAITAVPFRPSEPPIPLLRVSGEAPGPATHRGVPSVRPGEPPRPASIAVLAPRPATSISDPVIQLTRTKSLGPPLAKPSAEVVVGEPSSGAPGVAASLEVIDQAVSADDVAAALASGLGSVCRRVAVFSVRAGAFEGRAAEADARRAGARALAVPANRPSVLQTAAQTGRYVGPIPATPIHDELARFLGSPPADILVGAALVSGRAALVYAAAWPDTLYEATRRADQLTEAAGRKLERLLRERKR